MSHHLMPSVYKVGHCILHNRIYRHGIELCIDCCRDEIDMVEGHKPSFRDLVRIEMEKTHE